MLKATLTRKWFKYECALGEFKLYKDNAEIDPLLGYVPFMWFCYTCEPPVRGKGDPATVAEWKIKGDSAIPYGTYKVKKTYSEKYSQRAGKPVYMWELQNVPGFSGIRIHAGNTAKDTEGCLLFGKHINGDYNGIAQSKAAISEFEAIMDSLGNPEFELEVV